MAEFAQDLEQDIKELDRTFQQLRDEGAKWSELPNSDLTFRNLCVEIMNAVVKEYHHLKIGAQKVPQFAAWAARNLLELKIITKYVLASKVNSNRFINDMYADGIEFFEAIIRLQERNGREHGIPVDSGPARQTLSNLNAEGVRQGLGAKDRHLEMSKMADAVGLLPEYQDVNRICSKLVHRTAFSILAFDGVGELAFVAPFMFHVGGRYGLQIWEMLGRHVKSHGMQPAP